MKGIKCKCSILFVTNANLDALSSSLIQPRQGREDECLIFNIVLKSALGSRYAGVTWTGDGDWVKKTLKLGKMVPILSASILPTHFTALPWQQLRSSALL